MSTTIVRRAIPPAREAANRVTIDALSVAVNELSGAIGLVSARAVRVGELIDAGLLRLTPEGLVAPAQVSGAIGATISGTYTPVLTAVSNVASATSAICQWMRTDNIVAASGVITIDPITASVSSELGISLPIASVLSSFSHCGGTATAVGTTGLVGGIVGDTVNNRARLLWGQNTDVANRLWGFHFMYRIE